MASRSGVSYRTFDRVVCEWAVGDCAFGPTEQGTPGPSDRPELWSTRTSKGSVARSPRRITFPRANALPFFGSDSDLVLAWRRVKLGPAPRHHCGARAPTHLSRRRPIASAVSARPVDTSWRRREELAGPGSSFGAWQAYCSRSCQPPLDYRSHVSETACPCRRRYGGGDHPPVRVTI